MTDDAAERPLDAIDRKIIALLTADGRMSINELANQVSISRASAYSRVERLRTSGVIEGFTAWINPHKVGLDIAALIFVNADQHGWKTLQHKLLDLPGLEHLAVTTGTFDFSLLVRVRRHADAPRRRARTAAGDARGEVDADRFRSR